MGDWKYHFDYCRDDNRFRFAFLGAELECRNIGSLLELYDDVGMIGKVFVKRDVGKSMEALEAKRRELGEVCDAYGLVPGFYPDVRGDVLKLDMKIREARREYESLGAWKEIKSFGKFLVS
ncbi:hypothetical protein HNV12_00945 [Methanococcoides sp. SA1]|nr:hypothetical protein [Methanococcoides sp. SA1]